MVVEKNPNVFIDTAAYVTEIAQVLTSDIITRIGPQKIIFGTDYPMPYAGRAHRMKDFVECVQGLGLPKDVLCGIFSENIEQLLYGRKAPAPQLSAQEVLEAIRKLAVNSTLPRTAAEA